MTRVWTRSLIAVFAATAALGTAGAVAAQPQQNQVRAAFFANWDRYARGYFVNQIPAARLNVVDYAFAMPTAAGTCALSDPWSDYQARPGAAPTVSTASPTIRRTRTSTCSGTSTSS